MKKNTNTADKDFSWLLGVEDEADDKSTSKAETIVQEKGKSFLRKTLNPFLCLQFPPYLDVFPILL